MLVEKLNKKLDKKELFNLVVKTPTSIWSTQVQYQAMAPDCSFLLTQTLGSNRDVPSDITVKT